jgi:hypothetical protein
MLDIRPGKHVGQKGNNLNCIIWEQRPSTDVQASSINKEISPLKFVPSHVRNHLQQDADILKHFTFEERVTPL